jgi:hypothetical protein
MCNTSKEVQHIDIQRGKPQYEMNMKYISPAPWMLFGCTICYRDRLTDPSLETVESD